MSSSSAAPNIVLIDGHVPLAHESRRVTLKRLQEDATSFLLQAHRSHGDVVRVATLLNDGYLVSHPTLVNQVLVSDHDAFTKDLLTRDLGLFLGDGLLTSEGAMWRRHRKIAAPPLTKKHVAIYGAAMSELTERYLQNMPAGEERDVHVDMMTLTLQIVARTLFALDVGEDVQRISKALDAFMVYFVEVLNTWKRILPRWLPTPSQREMRQALATLNEVVFRLIETKRKQGAAGDDLLSLLLRATDDAGAGMSDLQLRDEVVTILLAGHETTAILLSYVLWQLAERAELQSRVRAEIMGVAGDRSLEMSDMAKLPLTTAVLNETLRLYNPAWIMGREATRDFDLGGVKVPAKAQVYISQWVLHRDPRVFDDPEAFKPERWLDGLADRLPKHAFLPFGSGPRVCIGNHFAMMEATLVLATLIKHRRFETAPSHRVGFTTSVTLRPTYGVKLRVFNA